jgi:hypothetical protein
MPVSILMVVVLPAPFTPRNANIPPAGTSSEMLFTATNEPYDFVRFLMVIIRKLLGVDGLAEQRPGPVLSLRELGCRVRYELFVMWSKESQTGTAVKTAS